MIPQVRCSSCNLVCTLKDWDDYSPLHVIGLIEECLHLMWQRLQFGGIIYGFRDQTFRSFGNATFNNGYALFGAPTDLAKFCLPCISMGHQKCCGFTGYLLLTKLSCRCYHLLTTKPVHVSAWQPLQGELRILLRVVRLRSCRWI